MSRKTATATERVDPETQKPIPDGQLGDWGDDIPADLRAAADLYIEKNRERADIHEEMTQARQNVIDLMQQHGIDRLKIDDGEKILKHTITHNVKVVSLKSEAEDDED